MRVADGVRWLGDEEPARDLRAVGLAQEAGDIALGNAVARGRSSSLGWRRRHRRDYPRSDRCRDRAPASPGGPAAWRKRSRLLKARGRSGGRRGRPGCSRRGCAGHGGGSRRRNARCGSLPGRPGWEPPTCCSSSSAGATCRNKLPIGSRCVPPRCLTRCGSNLTGVLPGARTVASPARRTVRVRDITALDDRARRRHGGSTCTSLRGLGRLGR